MEIILNTFGSYLRQKDGMFLVESEDRKTSLSPEKIERILITTAVSLTSDALVLAMQNNIDVVFMDKFGDPIGRLWHSRPGSTIAIKRRQLGISSDERGVSLALEWVSQKVSNQAEFLGELASNRDGEKKEKLLAKKEFIEQMLPRFGVPVPGSGSSLSGAGGSDAAVPGILPEIVPQVPVEPTTDDSAKPGLAPREESGPGLAMDVSALSGKIDEVRGWIMGNEGACGRAYFEALSYIMPQSFVFGGRSHRPAKDFFNAFLNYSYGVLYSLTERAILIAGLDPYIGFVHADNYNKPSLVYDLVERYRIVAEKTVVFLFTGKKVNADCCREIPGGYSLDKPGKELLLRSLNERLDEVCHYKGKNHKRRDIIQLDCHELAQRLLKEGNECSSG
jgi:CRISPR-associated protein Cas1